MKNLNERKFASKITMRKKGTSGVSRNAPKPTKSLTDLRQIRQTDFSRPVLEITPAQKKIPATATARPQIMKECTLRTLWRLKMMRKQMSRRLSSFN